MFVDAFAIVAIFELTAARDAGNEAQMSISSSRISKRPHHALGAGRGDAVDVEPD